jgi:hypothetical protein
MRIPFRMRCAGLAALMVSIASIALASNTSVPAGSSHYAPGAFPDRIVLVPSEDPASMLAVAWRTNTGVERPQVQFVRAKDSPDLADDALEVSAQTRPLHGSNGLAHHHFARITDLQPDTLYAYRVQGVNTWSEWFHVRTAAREPRPFSFLYFGDAQNSIKSLYSRVIRDAWRREPQAALMIHAGDLISGGDDRDDEEWGEWFDAGQFLHATALVVPAAGNHEHDDDPDDADRYVLKPSWSAHLPVPANGVPSLSATTYWFDYQGVRFITLDSSMAVANGLAGRQAQWLEPLLRDNPNRWTVVTFHHPMHSVSLGRDNPQLRKHWQPLLERYGVDLVLQGHDHVYGRGSNLAEGKGSRDGAGTVYVVSVAGPKQYRVSDRAQQLQQRIAENTQLYQIVRVSENELRYESRTVTGVLYDAFTLLKNAGGEKRLLSDSASFGAPRLCPHEQTRSGRRDRCWDGVEW